MKPILGPVRLWVRLYTAGLARPVKERRLAELESDLWEQIRLETNLGTPGLMLTLSIWARSLLGIADDLAWRAQYLMASKAAKTSKERHSKMYTAASRNKLVSLGLVVAAVIALAVTVITIDNIQYFDGSDHIVANSTLTALSFALVVAGIGAVGLGFVVMGSRPAEGAALAIGGSLTAALMTYWLLVPLVLAAVISFYAIRRARRIAGDMTSE